MFFKSHGPTKFPDEGYVEPETEKKSPTNSYLTGIESKSANHLSFM